VEQDPNYREMFPIHDAILALPNSYELTVAFWHRHNIIFDMARPWRYEMTKIREARDERIRQLIEQFPQEEHMQRHYGYCNASEREAWEMMSNKKAIIAEADPDRLPKQSTTSY